MSLIDEIKIKSLSEAQEILKAAGSEDIFEKAHKDGDLHPNGKWVWVSSAAGGKGDWRTLNGRTHKKHQAANSAGGNGGGSKESGGNTGASSPTVKKPSVANGGSGKSNSDSETSTTAKKTSTKKTTSGNSLKSKLDDIKRAISKNGYTANVSTDGSIVIYEKGARKTTENIKGRIKSFDDIDWGNKKGVQAKLESAIKAALEVGIVKKQASKGVSEKVNSIHIVDMQQSVRDKNSLLKQLKSSKSNKVLIHYHSTSGFDINKMRSIAEKEGWKITDKSVDKNGNHTYNVNSYIMFEKQTKK